MIDAEGQWGVLQREYVKNGMSASLKQKVDELGESEIPEYGYSINPAWKILCARIQKWAQCYGLIYLSTETDWVKRENGRSALNCNSAVSYKIAMPSNPNKEEREGIFHFYITEYGAAVTYMGRYKDSTAKALNALLRKYNHPLKIGSTYKYPSSRILSDNPEPYACIDAEDMLTIQFSYFDNINFHARIFFAGRL